MALVAVMVGSFLVGAGSIRTPGFYIPCEGDSLALFDEDAAS